MTNEERKIIDAAVANENNPYLGTNLRLAIGNYLAAQNKQEEIEEIEEIELLPPATIFMRGLEETLSFGRWATDIQTKLNEIISAVNKMRKDGK